jgi:hypothetical protein
MSGAEEMSESIGAGFLIYLSIGACGFFPVLMIKNSSKAAVAWLVLWPMVLMTIASDGLSEFRNP